MVFEQAKADISKRLSDLQKEEPIFLAHVVIKNVKEDPKTGKIAGQIAIDLAGAPSPIPLEKVLEAVDMMRKGIIERWGQKK